LVSATTYSDAQAAEQLLVDFCNQNGLDPQYGSHDAETLLADLNYDGIPELLFSESIPDYGLTVYQVKNNQVVELPNKITTRPERGENDIELLMDDTGALSFYFFYRKPAFEMGETDSLEHVIYSWSESGLTPTQYLGYFEYMGSSGLVQEYTTDVRADSNPYLAKIPTDFSLFSEKNNEYYEKTALYSVWRWSWMSSIMQPVGLTDIWNIQKERYFRKSADSENYAILQIGNPMMNVFGTFKSIDGENGTAPMILNGRTMIPVRAVVEEMGGSVAWDGETRTVTLSGKGITLELVIDSTTAYVNGVPQTLDVAPVIQNNRTMFPARFIAESFGYSVAWNEIPRAVVITGTN